MATEETATLGGGCFWCVEAVYQQMEGVSAVESGYMGGTLANPTYQQVCAGGTGHVEVVQVKFDPAVASFRDILEVFFAIHDPLRSTGRATTWACNTGPSSSITATHSAQAAEQHHSRTERRADLARADRHRSARGGDLLPRRGLSSDYFRNHPEPALLRRRGGAQGG
jgi:methionine-S-sulfoxide reductase